MPIGFPAATLGGEIEVPTLGGRASINVTEGTQTGKTFRLRGKGIKGVRASYPGDLYCHIVVETPVRLTDKQKNCYASSMLRLEKVERNIRRAPKASSTK